MDEITRYEIQADACGKCMGQDRESTNQLRAERDCYRDENAELHKELAELRSKMLESDFAMISLQAELASVREELEELQAWGRRPSAD